MPSPPASLSAGWADGYRFSIALAELGSPKRIEFAAGTRAAAGGALAKDQLNGWYDTRTGSGGVFDPVTGYPPATKPRAVPKPPAAPQRVGASRARRDGARIEWKTSARASKYEVWRSGTQRGRGLRVGTTTRTTFLDKRGARGVAYYYRAGNAAVGVPLAERCSAPGANCPMAQARRTGSIPRRSDTTPPDRDARVRVVGERS